MKLTILRIVLLNLLVCGVLIACADQNPVEDNSELSGSGSISFNLAIPSGLGSERTRASSGTAAEIVNYPSDFRVDALNVYLFNSDGMLVKSYLDVSNSLSETNWNTNVNLDNVPAGSNQTLLCVVNPEAFPILDNLKQSISLDSMLQITSQPIYSGDSEAGMFMICKTPVNVSAGSTNTIAAVLERGVARLDVFTADESIRVDSVIVDNIPSTSYLLSQEFNPEGKVSLRREVTSFNERSKVAYLNESKETVKVSVFFKRNEVAGLVELEVPTIIRNHIYSVNLEVPVGTHLVAGTLSVAEWVNHVLEGEVDSHIVFDREATVSSFRFEEGKVASALNDTTLLLPGDASSGQLYFQSGSEVTITLENAEDSTMVSVRRNAVSRGAIRTGHEINMKVYSSIDTGDRREVRLWVSNLMTGKGRTFIIRQAGAGYMAVDVPALTFENSHRYNVRLPLSGVTEVNQMVIPTDEAFNIEVTKQSNQTYDITISKKRIYDVVPEGKQLIVTKEGKPAIKLNMATDMGFIYKEVRIGNVTFMDRDLGASAVDAPGEIFIPGALIPVNQNGFSHRIPAFVGQGRPAPGNVAYNYGTKWFTKESGEKNLEIDPCPQGWHVATYAEYQTILTFITGQSINPIPDQGSLGTSVGFESSNKTVNVRLAETKLSFNYSGGHVSNVLLWSEQWPCGWWSSTKDGNGFYHLSFKVTSPYNVGLRNHGYDNRRAGLNIRCVKDR